MDAAQLWQLAALLARLDPDTFLLGLTPEQTAGYGKIKAIAQGSVRARRLRCLAYYQNPDQNPVLMSEFLRWAQEKELAIPPELKPPARTAPAPTGAAASSQIKGVKEFRDFCETRGLLLTSDRAAYAFMAKADIKPIDGHAKKGRRVWDAAAIEPKVIAESERRKQWPKKRPK